MTNYETKDGLMDDVECDEKYGCSLSVYGEDCKRCEIPEKSCPMAQVRDEQNPYNLTAKEIDSMKKANNLLTERNRNLEQRINDLEESLEGCMEDVKYGRDIAEVLLDGENYTKCDRCECLVHNAIARSKRDRTYCEQCWDEV